MFNSVSWSQYLAFLLVALSVYYFYIWVVYFKAVIPSFSVSKAQGEDQPDEALSTAQFVIDELRPLFKPRIAKNELIHALQSLLKKYNQWNEPDFRDTINIYIREETKTKCSILLDEDDLKVVWI